MDGSQIMTDYYPILRKAVDALDRPSRDNRYDVYPARLFTAHMYYPLDI